MNKRLTPYACAILAALLFGASIPAAKRLVGTVDPTVLAGLLYVGAGLGAAVSIAARGALARGRLASTRPRWTTKERLALAAAVLSGGLAAPIAMMHGLRAGPAATASLFLNFEPLATTLIAGVVFHEALGGRIWLGVLAITMAGGVLGWQPNGAWGISAGAFGCLVASVLWGLDNNLTRIVSSSDTATLVAIKGFCAGPVSLAIAALAGRSLPQTGTALTALALGMIGYGASVGLFVRALRDLGAARTSALFGTAPFFGAALSWSILREPFGATSAAALLLMAFGTAALLGERHRHRHSHGELFHDHSHTHDDGHHDHVHALGEAAPGARHAHRHRHSPMSHSHEHAPDIHHRHDHR